MPKVSTAAVVVVLVVVAAVGGLLIANEFGTPGMPVVAFTPGPASTPRAAAVASTTPAASATAEATATAGVTATAEASATAAVASATPAASATAEAAATAEATATAATAAAAGDPAFIEYTVRPGDTLIAIARRYGVATNDILAVNSIPRPSSLTVGQVLRIPVSAANAYIEYTIQAGDTLNRIGLRYGVSAEELQRLNDLPDPRSLVVGTVLRIPRR